MIGVLKCRQQAFLAPLPGHKSVLVLILLATNT